MREKKKNGHDEVKKGEDWENITQSCNLSDMLNLNGIPFKLSMCGHPNPIYTKHQQEVQQH